MNRHNPLSPFTMNKKFLQMMLLSAVVSVCFSSCDHVSFVHHINSRCVRRPVVHQPVVHRSVVVHQPVARQHAAPKPVVQHKQAPNPRRGKAGNPAMLAHNKRH